jgi:hypothetical protein
MLTETIMAKVMPAKAPDTSVMASLASRGVVA